MPQDHDQQPLTRADLNHALVEIRADLKHAIGDITAEILGAIATLKVDLRAEIQAAEERGQEFARAIETNLLSAFHGHTKGQTARLHSAETTVSDLMIRMAALEERMLNIETRRPPH